MRSAANDFLRCSSAKGFVSRQNHDFKRNSDPDENEAPFSWQFLAEQRQSQGTGYPSHSGRLNTLWMGGLGVFKEIAWSAPLGPWGASAVSGGEIDAKRALCSCVALASQWRLLIAGLSDPVFSCVRRAPPYVGVT
jgi:hypothetical protein